MAPAAVASAHKVDVRVWGGAFDLVPHDSSDYLEGLEGLEAFAENGS